MTWLRVARPFATRDFETSSADARAADEADESVAQKARKGSYASIAGPHDRPLTGARAFRLWFSKTALSWPAAFRCITDAHAVSVIGS